MADTGGHGKETMDDSELGTVEKETEAASESKSIEEPVSHVGELETRDISDTRSTTSSAPDDMSDGEKSLRSRRSSASTPTKISPTPSGSKSGRLSGSACSSRTATPPIGKVGRYPIRPGITWAIGAKVEAKDFLDKWYPARIVEIDDDDKTALVHFEGWNARYDEWMDMNTDRLRPMTRHSERKEKPRGAPRGEHRIGECVFAKWSDCRMYAARVININTNGSYEVLFYDGVKKTVQPINIKTMPPDVQKEYASAGLLPPAPKRVREIEKQRLKKEREREQRQHERERREHDREKGRVPLAEKDKSRESSSEKPKEKEQDKRKLTGPKKEEGQATPKSEEAKNKSVKLHVRGFGRLRPNRRKVPELSEDSNVAKSVSQEGLKKRKLVIGGIFQAKRAKVDSSDEKKDKEKEKKKLQAPEVKPSTVSQVPVVSKPEKSPAVTAPESFLMQILKCTQSPISCTSPTLYSHASTSSTSVVPAKAAKSRHPSAGSIDSRPESLDSPGTPQVERKAAPKEFKIEEDHNPFKCSVEYCTKGFRKQSLLDYHIKYYHTEDGKPVGPPPRKRKKTISVCSTDSDISVGGRSTSSKSSKKKRDSIVSTASSMPETPTEVLVPAPVEIIADDESTVDYTAEVQNLGTDDLDNREIVMEEEVETELEKSGGNKDEVVNCICQLNEENGLMIQCEVCLCWQHAVCMEFSLETVPRKYVCYICANPPGVRENSRFIYNQDWFKEGNLARFNFLPVEENRHPQGSTILATHTLTAYMHNLMQLLGALNKQLHILQEKDHSHAEFKLWTKNWDREMERQKQDCRASIDMDGEQTMDTSISESSSAVESVVAKVEPIPESSGVTVTPDITSKLETVKEEPVEEVGGSREPSVQREVMVKTEHGELCSGEKKSELVKEESLDSLKDIGTDIKGRSLEENSETDTASQLSENEDMGKVSESEDFKGINQDMAPRKVDMEAKDVPETFHEKKTFVAVPSSSERAESPTASQSEKPNSQMSATNLHDYSLGPIPSGVKEGGSKVWTTVKNKASSGSIDQDGEDLESDVSVVAIEEDPYANCEKNLLEHIMNMQDKIEGRLDYVEEQIAALEEADQALGAPGPVAIVGRTGARQTPNPADILSDLPYLRKQVHHLLMDLSKVKRMARYH